MWLELGFIVTLRTCINLATIMSRTNDSDGSRPMNGSWKYRQAGIFELGDHLVIHHLFRLRLWVGVSHD